MKKSNHTHNTEAKKSNSSAVGKALADVEKDSKSEPAAHSKEYGGRKDGLDPTRYGDWEKNGRCIDF